MQIEPLRLLYMGAPKSGKTASIASLANCGWQVRYLDFDGNAAPLMNFTKPENRKNLHIVRCIDKLKMERVAGKQKDSFDEVFIYDGKPSAWSTMHNALFNKWPDDGSDPKQWDPRKNVLILDSLSTISQAKLRLSQYVSGRQMGRRSFTDYGAAQEAIEGLLHALKGSIACPVIVIAHIDIAGPDLHVDDIDDEELKNAMLRHKLKGAEKTPWAIGPVTVGKAQLRNLPIHFSGSILAEPSKAFGRQIHTAPREGLNLGVPLPGIKDALPLDSGLATILNAWVANLGDAQTNQAPVAQGA